MKLKWPWSKKKSSSKDISIHEDITGRYRYHIAINNTPLCGSDKTMRRDLDIASWGIKRHIGERYCKKCEKLWIERKKIT